ncbi:MAG: plasmid pRiA4b ORF-3 family protein [Culicoidibacterales bacterium]
MQICCSQKLLKTAKKTPISKTEPEFFSWSATLYEVNHQRVLFVTNDATRLSFVVANLPQSAWQNLTTIIIEGIREVFTMFGASEEMIAAYFDQADELEYSKSRGPVYMGRVGHVTQEFRENDAFFEGETLFQFQFTHYINTIPAKVGTELIFPAQETIHLLQNLTTIQRPAKEQAAFDVLIRIDFGARFAARRLYIPQDFTFSQLHDSIQIAFGWENRHAYAFDGLLPNQAVRILSGQFKRLVPHEEQGPVILTAEKTKLADVFVPGMDFEYVYDFESAWQHTIHIRGFAATDVPRCLLASGGCPPEDIGGPDGYGFLCEMLEHIELLPPEEQLQLHLLAPQLVLTEPNILKINHDLKQIY